MKSSVSFSSLEVLEARIAPANILLQSLGGDASKAIYTKTTSTAEKTSFGTAAVAAGADLAIMLEAGDTLVLDSNNNGVFDAKLDKTIIAKATAGRTLLLFTDLNHDHKISIDELSGLRVSDGFNGSVTGSIHGSIVTDLSKSGVAAAVTGKLGIDKLSVGGQVDGLVLAGGALKGLTISGGTTSSVQAIKTGSAAAGTSYSLNGGAKTLGFTGYNASVAGNSSIANLTLASGTALIAAGQGGSISDVTIGLQSRHLLVKAGEASAAGTAGGSISGITVNAATGSFDYTFLAGSGADNDGAKVKTGGNGGSVSGLALFKSSASVAGSLTVSAGQGGAAIGSAAAGNGGAIIAISANVTNGGAATLTAGTGGDSEKGAGGDGGALGGAKSAGITLSGFSSLSGEAGNGGTGGAAGAGGAITHFAVAGNALSSLTLQAGIGADVVDGFDGKGGTGGSITDLQISVRSLETLELTAGNAGLGGAKYNNNGDVVSAGSGGAGGSILDLHLAAQAGSTEITLLAGTGGDSGSEMKAAGGAGGSIGDTAGIGLSQVASLEATAGNGGLGANAGAGGSLSSFTLSSVADDATISLTAGDAGSGLNAQAEAGSIRDFKISSGGALESVSLMAGSAASATDGAKTDGAKGGSISRTSIVASSLGAFTLQAGAGAAGAAKYNDNGDLVAGGAGGDGGNIAEVALSLSDDFSSTDVLLTAGSAGDGAFTGAGGAGGSIAGLSLDHVDSAAITAGSGGSAADFGNGGAGGSISAIAKFIAAGDSNFTAGNGGDGAEGGSGGVGGSITGSALASLTSQGGSWGFTAGAGGVGSARYNANDVLVKSGAGGAGGSLQGLKVVALDDSRSLDFTAGVGGDGAGKAAGGKGGSVRDLTISAPLGLSGFVIVAGDSGLSGDEEGSPAAFGGDVLNVAVTGDDSISLIAEIVAGGGMNTDDGSQDGVITNATLNGGVLIF